MHYRGWLNDSMRATLIEFEIHVASSRLLEFTSPPKEAVYVWRTNPSTSSKVTCPIVTDIDARKEVALE